MGHHQPEMFLNHDTGIFEIQTAITKLKRIISEKKISKAKRNFAKNQISICLKLTQNNGRI